MQQWKGKQSQKQTSYFLKNKTNNKNLLFSTENYISISITYNKKKRNLKKNNIYLNPLAVDLKHCKSDILQ